MGGLLGAGAAAAAGAAGAAGGIASSVVSTIVPIASAITQAVGGIVKGVSGGGINKQQQVPYPLTGDQSGIAQGLTQSLGNNFGTPQIGGFGGLPGMGGGGGNGMLQRVTQLQQRLGQMTSQPPATGFRR